MPKTISVTRKGMIRDVNPLNLDGTSYPFAMNASVESNSESGNMLDLQNEGSNVLQVTLPVGYVVIGRKKVHEQNRTLLALVNVITGESEIGEILHCEYNDDTDDKSAKSCQNCGYEIEIENTPLEEIEQVPYCSYHTITNANCFNFNINYPVRIVYKITDCGLNIYFTDRLNQRRFIYFDYENGSPSDHLVLSDRFKVVVGYEEDCEVPIYSEELDCNKINYHPTYLKPCIDFAEVIFGGNLLAGSYQFIVAYADVKGNFLTDSFPATNIIPISTKQITFDTNYKTDKAIALTVSNLEQSNLYGYYNLVVAETVDSVTQFKLVGTFPVTQSKIIYTGAEENLKLLTADEIFTKRTYYAKAGNITDANNLLFFSDLEEFSRPNLQLVANNISLYWKTVAIPEAVYKDPKNTFFFRGYQRDEVYPFGIVFVKFTGEELGPFHLPGPSKQKFLSQYSLNVDSIVANNDVLLDTSCNNITRNKLWQVYNTGLLIAAPHESTPDCDPNKTWEWGEFSYWESIRRYPNVPEVWGDLCGQPIRFHKFPDSRVTHIHDGLNAEKDFTDSNIVYPIGIRVDHTSVQNALDEAVKEGIITAEEKDEISEYRIVRGNRVGNKSVVAKGLLYDMWDYQKNDVNYYYPNYPYNDLGFDNYISNDEDTYEGGNNSNPIPNTFTPSRRYTFHSPDTHFNEPTLGTEIKLETEEYGSSEGYFNEAEEQAKYKFLSTFATTLAFAAGVAAAFSAEKEKECKTIVSRSLQAITGTNPGATLTLPSAPGVNYVPILPPNSLMYDDFTGLPIGLGGTDPINPLQVVEVQRNTCRGKTFQLLSPLSGNPAGIFLQQAVYMSIIGLKEMQIMFDVMKAIIPYKNFAVQYNSVGRYNNYLNINNGTGNKIRAINRSAYLDPIIQLVNEAIDTTTNQYTNVYINNWNRERSVYLKTDPAKPALPSPTTNDNSRFTMDQRGLDQEDLEKREYSTIASYYASIKNYLPDQYGTVSDVEYLETNGCTFDLSTDYTISESGVFGGDTFINRFALKRKMPFFIQTRFRFGNDSDVRYSELGNVGYPNYYFNSEEPLLERMSGNTFGGDLFGILTDILGVANTRLDAKKQKVFYQSGFIHLYNYGIPYFLAESDVNVDYRHGENNKEKDFYPHQQDLDFWLQEKNVPISEDNYYFYNKTYSKQNKESVLGRQVIDPQQECKGVFPFRVIQSERGYNDTTFDNWLVFKANNTYDAPASYGRVIGLDGIENEKLLVRYQNNFDMFNVYDVLNLETTQVAVGNGGIFNSRPKQFAQVPLGYAGSQHTDMIHTEYGHIWADAKRGQIFNLLPNATGLDELAAQGMKNWFKENLPFQILKDFPTIDPRDVDNNFKGIGLHLAFDKRFSRFFITKLDYKVLSDEVEYNPELKRFQLKGIDGVVVSLDDERYFCNKSWTVSYSFITKSWISFHSFKPNFYIEDIDQIDSGINDFPSGVTTVWSHNVTNKSYQVYYGDIYPFIVEVLSNPTAYDQIINSIEYDCDVLRYHNQFDTFFTRKVTFNKAIVYNDRQCSGLLRLRVNDEEDLYEGSQYPKVVNNEINILVTNRDNKWRFNDFYDTVNSQTGNVPFFKNECSNVDKNLYLRALNYYKPDIYHQAIRSRQVKTRLINDEKSNYKFILHLTTFDQTPTQS